MENNRFLTTSEAAKLLNINEKKLYILAQNGTLPATKITGKWLFPYKELTNFLKYSALKNIKKGIPLNLIESDIILGAGSDDPILQKIFSLFHNETNLNIFYSTIGSKNGIDLLKNRIVHFSLSHLYNAEENNFNQFYLKKIFKFEEYVLINLFYRDIGLVSKNKITNIDELKEKKYTFILRQKGSGIRNLTDQLLLNITNISFYPEEINTHIELATLVKENQNLTGITTKSTANMFGLNFLKLFSEQFDIVTLKDYFFIKQFQNFVEFIRNLSDKFKNIEGYNFYNTGKILT